MTFNHEKVLLGARGLLHNCEIREPLFKALILQSKRHPATTFALKCMKKQHIVETHQQDHVFR